MSAIPAKKQMMKPTMAVPLFIMIVILWLKFEVGPPSAGRNGSRGSADDAWLEGRATWIAARPSTSRWTKNAPPVFGGDGKRLKRQGQVAARGRSRKAVGRRADPGVVEAVRHDDRALVGPPSGSGDDDDG